MGAKHSPQSPLAQLAAKINSEIFQFWEFRKTPNSKIFPIPENPEKIRNFVKNRKIRRKSIFALLIRIRDLNAFPEPEFSAESESEVGISLRMQVTMAVMVLTACMQTCNF